MMKSIISATALALPVLITGCTTRVVYAPAPPPAPVVVQSAPASPPPPPPTSENPPPVAAAPQAVPTTPPPATAPAGYTPDYYVWDGYEYVGVYGDQYVYWTGGAWVVCPPIVIGRFHGWEHYHPGWRGGAYRYYRGRPHYR